MARFFLHFIRASGKAAITCVLLMLSLVMIGVARSAEIKTSVPCGQQKVRNGRIVGGTDAYDGEFPWIISLRKDGGHACGGTILNKRWILTAAHCVTEHRSIYKVRVGEYNLEKEEGPGHNADLSVQKIIRHPQYGIPRGSANDIALVRLSSDISFSDYVRPVCLPPQGSNDDFAGKTAVVIGWGATHENDPQSTHDVLQKLSVPVLKNSVCQSWYDEGIKAITPRRILIRSDQVCAGYENGEKDACRGDSGGPLLVKEKNRYTVIGVVASGIGCARKLLPGLYSRVTSYVPWILQNVGQG